jgi:uncharacterized protein (TIGR03435 family)
MQTLLAEHFGMRLQREQRVRTGSGERRRPRRDVTPQSAEDPIQGGTTVGAGGSAISTGPAGDSKMSPGQDGNPHIENKKMTMARRFAEFIGRYNELPVVDLTGLKGVYEMEFDVSGEEVRNAARVHGVAIPPPAALGRRDSARPSGVSVAFSLRKLGLKLESRKAPVW